MSDLKLVDRDATSSSPSSYEELLQEAYKNLTLGVEGGEADGWRHDSCTDEVDVYFKPDPNSSLNLMKGVGEVPYSATLFSSVYIDLERKPKWDSMFASGKLVERVDESTVISYQAYKGIWPVSGRDFVTVSRIKVDEDGIIRFWNASITHDKCPEEKGLVRGTISYAGAVVQPLAKDRCKVTLVISSNLNGSVPNMMIKKVNMRQPVIIANVRKYIATASAEELQASIDKGPLAKHAALEKQA